MFDLRDKLRVLGPAFLCLLLACQVENVQSPANPGPLWGNLAPGVHPIGFTILHVPGTPQDEVGDRIVRVALWYPADATSEVQGIRFGEYLEQRPDAMLSADFERWANNRDRESLQRQFFGEQAVAQTETLMVAPTAVFPDASPTAGPFPLVLHSLGRNGGQFESTILWEYLASHGYVVASVGQFGSSLEEPALEFSWQDQALQLEDMRAALLHLAAMPNISAEQVGLLGHSSGAVVALLLAAEDDRVHGVVGLDGSMNREEGRQLLESALGERRLSTPVLNLCRWPHPEFDEGILGRTDESTIRIGYERAIHFDFQNWPAYQSYADAEEQRSLKVRTVDEARRVFESAAVFARLFLDAELREDDGALEKLTDSSAVAEISGGLATLEVIGAE